MLWRADGSQWSPITPNILQRRPQWGQFESDNTVGLLDCFAWAFGVGSGRFCPLSTLHCRKVEKAPAFALAAVLPERPESVLKVRPDLAFLDGAAASSVPFRSAVSRCSRYSHRDVLAPKLCVSEVYCRPRYHWLLLSRRFLDVLQPGAPCTSALCSWPIQSMTIFTR